jgi:2-oxo-4-hydroxy-4-carboxy-5-ureidoimidazoline decarboxylase
MTIAEFDHLDNDSKRKLFYQCCASTAWVEKMLTIPTAEDLIDLFEDAEEKWYECEEEDWKEAFSDDANLDSRDKEFYSAHHNNPQPSAKDASGQGLESLADLKNAYEKKFGYVFVVDAEKSPEEILDALRARLSNTPEEEIKIAMEEQNRITRVRLEKLFES